MDEEAKVIANYLYGRLYSHDGLSQRCRIFRGEAYLQVYWYLHHDNQQRYWCYVSAVWMVDDLLASSCVTVWQATDIFDLGSGISCSLGGCTNVSVFWNLSGNQNHPGKFVTFYKMEHVVLIMEGLLWRTG